MVLRLPSDKHNVAKKQGQPYDHNPQPAGPQKSETHFARDSLEITTRKNVVARARVFRCHRLARTGYHFGRCDGRKYLKGKKAPGKWNRSDNGTAIFKGAALKPCDENKKLDSPSRQGHSSMIEENAAVYAEVGKHRYADIDSNDDSSRKVQLLASKFHNGTVNPHIQHHQQAPVADLDPAIANLSDQPSHIDVTDHTKLELVGEHNSSAVAAVSGTDEVLVSKSDMLPWLMLSIAAITICLVVGWLVLKFRSSARRSRRQSWPLKAVKSWDEEGGVEMNDFEVSSAVCSETYHDSDSDDCKEP